MNLPEEIPRVELIRMKLGESTLRILPSVHNSLHFCRLDELLEGSPHLLLEFPEQLERKFFQAVERLPIPTLIYSPLFTGKMSPVANIVYAVHPGDSVYWSAYHALKSDLQVTLIDTYVEGRADLMLDPASIPFVSWEEFYGQWKGEGHFGTIHARRSYRMARRVEEVLRQGGDYALVCGIAHVPVIMRHLERSFGTAHTLEFSPTLERDVERLLDSSLDESYLGEAVTGWELADVDPKSIFVVMGDIPYLVQRSVDTPGFSYLEGLRDLYFEAHKAYRTKFDDSVSPATFRRLFQFLRNLSRIRGYLVPSMIDMLTAANAMVDGDYAFEVYRVMVSFAYLPSRWNRLERTFKVIPDESLSQSIRFTFRVRMPRPVLKKRTEDDDPFEDPIPDELYPGHWQEIWEKHSPYSTVSYPPEDVYIENYFNFLRRRAQEILAEEKAVVEKFSTSLEDGIAWHETLRNWHEKKIYVKRVPRTVPDIGALIVQFQEEHDKEYEHHSTLYAEHEKESDISIVSTNPGDEIIGPGITRIKIAAIVSVFPPQHYAVQVPYGTDDLKTKLLYTAMNMATSDVIVLVAPRPPTAAHRYFVRSYGYKLLYIPMQQLTKASLHRLRTMHLLAHPDLREIARQYIGF